MLRPKNDASLWVLVSCGVLVAAAWCVFWWLAVPRHEICAMRLPAPAGCNSGRVPVAVVCTVLTAVLYGVLLVVEVKMPRRRWRFVAVLALVIGVIGGYRSVLYA